jgi:hypothetical protein
MADELFAALSGLNTSPVETPYGIAAAGVGQTLPGLITPYTSPGKAIGIGLGSILLQSLLAYQARSQANQESLQANTLANQMALLKTPEERTQFIGGVESPVMQSRLLNLSSALLQRESARKATIEDQMDLLRAKADFELSDPAKALQQQVEERARRAKIADLEAAAQFELGDVGQQLFQRKQAQQQLENELAIEKAKEVKKAEAQAGIAAALSPEGQQLFERDLEKQRQAAALRPALKQSLATGTQKDLAATATFVEAAKAHRDRISKMSPAELKLMLSTGTSGMGLFGDPGFIQENEALAQLYRVPNFGTALTGQEKKAADIITGKTLSATKEDILSAWDVLIKTSDKKAKNAAKIAAADPGTIVEVVNDMMGGGNNAEMEAKRQRNAELKARLAKLEAMMGGK